MSLLKTGRSEEKEVDVALGDVAWLVPKMKDHLLFVKSVLQTNVQLLQRRVRFLDVRKKRR